MKYFYLFLVFIFGNLQTFSQTEAQPDSDLQFWNETQVFFPLVKREDKTGKKVEKVSFFLSGNLRAGRHNKRLIDERIGFGFDFRINKYLVITPSYLYRAGRDFQNRREFESRFRLAVTPEKKWSRVSLSDRNLLEYRLRNSRQDSVRYRNRLQLGFPVVKKDKEVFTPFVRDEVFYDFGEGAWTRNELTLGISRKFSSQATADFFYLYQHNRSDLFKNVGVFGVNLKFTVD